MKKILSLVLFLLAASVFCQSEELLKMYQRMTGKDLSKEIERLKAKQPPTKMETQPSVIDTVLQDISGFKQTRTDSLAVSKTYFEKYVSGELINPYESELKQFRIDFSSIRTNLNYNKTVPDVYILSPGDVFSIDIWGSMEKNYSVEVTNEIFVIIPQIGKIDLSGLNYKEAKNRIESKLSSINGIKYSVRLSEVKPITVFVVGNIYKPGVYNVSPFSSIVEVMAVAGGITPEGSLRNIGLISPKTGSRMVDLYSLLFFGENPVSVLEPNMTIFIPLIGNQTAVAGNVKREGIFEILKNDRLEDILKIAGRTPFSDTDRIEIERLDQNGRVEIMSVSLKENPSLRDGDIIRIFSTLVFNSRYVYLKGNFRHNRKVQFNDGMKLGDILNDREVIFENSDMNYANIIRKSGLGNRDVLLNFSPKSVFDSSGDELIALFPRDTVEIFSIDSVSYFPSVEVSGEINKPGVYKYTKEMTVSNLLSYSGGLSSSGDISNIIIIRNNGQDGFEYFSGAAQSFILKPDDKMHVFDYSAKKPLQSVGIWGNVKMHGNYIHSPNMSVYDLISLAGGFRKDAITDSVEVVSGINKENTVLKTRWVDIKEAKSLILEPNDIVFVRRIRDFAKVNYVKIFGEVQFPGMYALTENEEFSNLLARCGGFTKNAQIKSTQIFRQEVKEKQARKIKELRDELNNKLQLQMILSGNKDLANALNIAKFDSIEASGRVILDIDDKGNHEEFFFQDRDSIFVPTQSRTILVMGEVYQQTAITYNAKNRKVGYYLDKVGGITSSADKKNIYVIKSNGELIKEKGWFDNIRSYSLEPGDMIYVPYDYNRIDFFQLTKDITTILYQLSLSAATVYQMSR